MDPIVIYADGGCSGNPGPGAWAALILAADGKKTLFGSEKSTTNNRMELKAVISALSSIAQGSITHAKLEIYTDSQYVKKGITEWIHAWIKNGWKNSAKEPVKNQDLWKEMYALSSRFSVEWHWVKGHADDALNNECDAIVRREIKKLLQKG